jgi:hypothetical protein
MSKTSNEYVRILDHRMYETTPKAVFAAIAISYATLISGDENLGRSQQAIINEWQALYNAGIIPQKPPTQRNQP